MALPATWAAVAAVASLSAGVLDAQEPAPPSAEPGQAPAPSPTVVALAPAQGRSLGDAIKKNRDEKEPKKRSLGVITNESLKKPSVTPTASKAKQGGTMTVLPAGTPGSSYGKVAVPVVRDQKGRTEEEWRQLVAQNRRRQERADTEVKRLELETRRLENDFYAWSDGNYRDRVIRPNWEQAREDLKKARVELDAASAAHTDLEEDARRSGAPPGWLRDR